MAASFLSRFPDRLLPKECEDKLKEAKCQEAKIPPGHFLSGSTN